VIGRSALPAAILALARSGATQRAWDAFRASGFDTAEDDFELLTLKGRLLKDRAKQAAGAERTALFAQAGAAYERAATLRPDSYPLINAAAMALFADDRVRAELLANKVQNLIESGADTGETPYWGEATRAEALLLLGRNYDARSSLQKAISLAPQAWEDHAATLGQFGAILAATGDDTSWLDPLRPPPTLHFTGILGIAADDIMAHQAIDAAIRRLSPGFGYGALAAGADIIAAEALLVHGAELHVVLPSEPAEFRAASVDPFGHDWAQRFDALLDDAQSITICGQGEATSTAGVTLAEYHAMGLTIEKAAQLQTKAIAMRMEPAERVSPDDLWTGSGRSMHRVDIRVSSSVSPSPLPEGQLLFDIVIDGTAPQSFDSLDLAVRELKAAGDAMMALDSRIGQRSRIAALSAAARRGVVVASRDAGLALLASGMAERVEPCGEIATNDGPLEFCLATLCSASF
jgi:tetratricopeptide (TPR) repeat protein